MKTLKKGLSLVLLFIIQTAFGATDTITADQMIRDGETLVSSDGVFELGFFKPGNSMNRYVGMWYRSIPDRKFIWVANREAPLTSAGGLLKVIQPGLLVLLNDTNHTVWSSNTSRPAQNPIAQLLDSGNLVVRDANDDRPENFLWQSFDYPTDVAIPGMKFGWNLVTGAEIYFSTWKSDDDPSPGALSLHLDPTGYPQILLKEGSKIRSRMGPWNGITFSGGPNDFQNSMYRLRIVMNQKEVRYWQETIDKSFVTIVAINPSGVAERWAWVNRTQRWMMYISFPADNCDTYRLCGAYGNCSTANSPLCTCMDRFVPKDPEGWAKADWNNGCVRRTNLSCQGDIFLRYSGIKLPDARYTWNNASMTIEECRAECLKNCSCMAYTQLDIHKGNGCLIWYEELIDIKSMASDGQDIYIRMASTEEETAADPEGKKRKTILIASFASALGMGLIGLSLSLYIRKRFIDPTISTQRKYHVIQEKNSELPLFDFSYILKATGNFAIDNKLGEGGFGPVYKGVLEDGQEVAVKRLSKDSMQGLDEFKNEIIFIAKLQHRNLVRLIGGCIQGEENMLIYEYMPNKSLDMIIFDQRKKLLLDWERRFNIINGIARGLLYLHQDSRLTIIHRDLKASNILLDSGMNPKISDFGIARSFGGNETATKTRRVVGTYGYMSPEYAIDGLFSVKSDIFSFGVLALEIVTGMSNRGFTHTDHNLNLLGHAWTLHKEGRSLELVDPCLAEPFNFYEMLRAIHVSLLCVQQNPKDRPSMSTVVTMLNNEGFFPSPKQPGFFTERELLNVQSSTRANAVISTNEVTITLLEASSTRANAVISTNEVTITLLEARSTDQPQRFHIINGIARGLMYLRQDSCLRIIHRDLKASNILLDSDMNPKISDFGLARIFGGNETGVNTNRVLGTRNMDFPTEIIN